MRHFFKVSGFFVLSLCLFADIAWPLDIFIMSSSDIIPYNNCVEGIRESLSEYSLQATNIAEDLEKGRNTLLKISNKNPKVFIAVGPQAAFVLSKQQNIRHRIFCMVLNPLKLLGPEGIYPGISLNIPPQFQIEKIKAAFPKRKKVGVFYNKKSNRPIIDSFKVETTKRGMTLAPFPILSTSEIPAIINSNEFSIDVLLITPDDQINSTKIVKYLIKESLRRKIPVVGYNSWFAKNGALLSFVIDYKNVGKQTGEKAKSILQNFLNDAGIVPPAKIKISVDLKTANKLGVEMAPEIIQQADEVIKQ